MGSMDPSPGFSQVFILKVLKVACFHTLLQVFILKLVSGTGLAVVHKVRDQNEGTVLGAIDGRGSLQKEH